MCSVITRAILTAGRLYYRSSHAYTYKALEFSQVIPKRSYSDDKDNKKSLFDENETTSAEDNLSPGVMSDYKLFKEEDSPMVLDVEEEINRLDLEALTAIQDVQDPYEGLNMKRGVEGVFDIEDLVCFLQKDKAQNIFVTKVPKELTYVNYFVIVTARSPRHMKALATFIRKAFKLRRNEHDIIPKIEGPNASDWVALDLGNIALHIFSKPTRSLYDLETLWAIGPEYDKQLQYIEAEEQFENKYKQFLQDLQPADEPESPVSGTSTS